MAFNARKIYPLDTKPSVAVGIGLPFNGPAVFNSTYLTKDAIKSNLINYFLTDRYERYLNNNFGANLKAFIFEQITNDNLSLLKEDIQAKINQYFSNINVESLELNSLPDTNEINIKLTYSIPNTNISDKIEITF
jgi:phage baseplate assembly protein W